MPVVVLRQAGFPLSPLDQLRCPELDPIVERFLAAERDVETATRRLESLLARTVPQPEARAAITAKLRSLAVLPARYVRLLSRHPTSQAAGDRWTEAAGRREAARRELRDRLALHLEKARRATVDAFRGQALREVLLLSNDAQYQLFHSWLDSDAARQPRRERALADMLVGYLQRVCTKNETHSHFGPFTPALLSNERGVSWKEDAAPVRTTLLSYWAAEEIARMASRDPVLREEVRPRRRPLALLTGARIDCYVIETETGGGKNFERWPFVRVGGREIDDDEAWLLHHCDGTTTIRDLRRSCQRADRSRPTFDRSFDEVLAGLVRDGFVLAEFEIPSGTCSALSDLDAVLRGTSDAATPYLELLEELDELLRQFAVAAGYERADLLGRIKTRFTEFTGVAPNRGEGQIYVDRSVLFEECRNPVRDLRIGREVADLLSGELTLAYELVLVGPRLRIQRETRILHRWCVERYGRDSEVPLGRFYADYFDDRNELQVACAEVEWEMRAVADSIAAALVGDPAPEARRVEVDPQVIRGLVDSFPAWPGAMLNPDVMLIAKDVGAIDRGQFQAVIGDCHALREFITHGGFAPFLPVDHPEVTELVTASYRQIVDDDELLADVVRKHLDKTFAQLQLDMPDLEVMGLSRKPREDVITPTDLYIEVGQDELALRAHGRRERLRLLAPPAGGPSVASDPLSVFAFPRHYEGVGLTFPGRAHVPRITSGRVVLSRERWQIPLERLAPDSHVRDDGNDFLRAQVVRRALRLPDQVFAHLPTEPKPIYVDWDSPLLVRHLMRRIKDVSGDVELTEMLPGPDDLWLEIDGERYTSELRVAVFSPPGPRSTRDGL